MSVWVVVKRWSPNGELGCHHYLAAFPAFYGDDKWRVVLARQRLAERRRLPLFTLMRLWRTIDCYDQTQGQVATMSITMKKVGWLAIVALVAKERPVVNAGASLPLLHAQHQLSFAEAASVAVCSETAGGGSGIGVAVSWPGRHSAGGYRAVFLRERWAHWVKEITFGGRHLTACIEAEVKWDYMNAWQWR